MVEGFLLGVIATASLIASLFFLKFWVRTRDSFFLAFVIFFFAEAAIRTASLFVTHPNEGSPWIYVVRLLALLVILLAVLHKNYAAPGRF